MIQTRFIRHNILFIFLMGILVSGCATNKAVEQTHAVFYPEPPAPPRVQFLRSLNNAKDIEEGMGGFDKFLVGDESAGIELIKPYGVTTAKGKIYVCDSQGSVMVFDLEKKSFYQMEGARGLGKVVQPMNISKDESGNKFVTDPLRGEVLMYDNNDMYVKSFSSPVKWKPMDSEPFEGLLYVVDSLGKRILVYDIDSGKAIRELGQKGEDQAENLSLPTNIVINNDGNLVVSDSGRFQLVVYDRDGHLLHTIGKLGTNFGHFARPRGVAVDREGQIYATDGSFENVQLFRPDGQLLVFFGGTGTNPGNLYLPAGVAIDYENVSYFKEYIDPNFDVEYLIIVISQFGQRVVSVYGYGKERGREYLTEEELEEKMAEKREEFLKDVDIKDEDKDK